MKNLTMVDLILCSRKNKIIMHKEIIPKKYKHKSNIYTYIFEE